MSDDDTPRVRTSRPSKHTLEITLARQDKLNAFDLRMLRELAEAVTELEEDHALRCGLLRAEGRSFTAGLDLAEVGPAVERGERLFPKELVDPLGLNGRVRTKPLIIAVQGHCLTLGIELLLAADIAIAAEDSLFGQIEINRGIFPFGGATIRLPQRVGWGNAMRWLLTGERFDAAEALRMGLVQEVTPTGEESERSRAIARTIASRAPLGIRATLDSARRAIDGDVAGAQAELLPQARALMATDDAAEGLRSFVERREASFEGR